MNDYQSLVKQMLSETVSDPSAYANRIEQLLKAYPKFSMLDAGITGLGGETGELVDLLKKIKFHDKDIDNEMHVRLMKEAGDVMFYLALTAEGLGITLDGLMTINRAKLEKRFTEGKFNLDEDRNRKNGDI